MSILVVVEAQVKPENISEMKSYMADILPDTRAYDGCQGIDLYFNTEVTGGMVLIEHWDSRAHYEKYRAWTNGTGFLDRITPMLAGPISLRYFERGDA